MNAFKQQCIELRKRDYTLGEIVKITQRPKTSVYAHIRDIPLSKSRWNLIRAAHKVHALQLAAKRRGKSSRTFKKFSSWDTDTVSLVSHFIFDGEIKRGGCVYFNRNLPLVKHVENCMRKIYAYEPRHWQDKLTGVHRISYFNVSLVIYLKEKATNLLANIHKMPIELKKEFIRSFFDDEGCMDFRQSSNLRQIRGYQKNVEILDIIQRTLTDLGIASTVVPPNEVKIVGRENLLKFQKEINFSPGVRINGDRPNSVWKQHLEKREILRRAIESYKPLGSNGVHRH